jgi:hypothetical protein
MISVKFGNIGETKVCPSYYTEYWHPYVAWCCLLVMLNIGHWILYTLTELWGPTFVNVFIINSSRDICILYGYSSMVGFLGERFCTLNLNLHSFLLLILVAQELRFTRKTPGQARSLSDISLCLKIRHCWRL